MTRITELFHSRRISFGLRNATVDDLGLDSPPADANSHHRSTTTAATSRRHHQFSGSHNNRRDHHHDLDGCNPPPRWIRRHRLWEQSGSQSPSGSIINSENFRSICRPRATGNDRLPGAVLLARERLVERLRSVSVSGNRQSSSSSSSIHQDDFSFSANSSFLDPENNLSEITWDWLEEPASESWQAVMSMSSSSQARTRRHCPGLTQNVLDCLPLEVFSSVEKFDEISSASRECTVCLEVFQDGDELIRLPCLHRFHPGCLFPWVRVCGACPNCRKAIVVSCSSK